MFSDVHWCSLSFHWCSLMSLIFIDVHWLSLTFIDFHSFSFIGIDCHWFSFSFIDCHWFSMVYIDFHWCSLIFIDLYGFVAFICFHWCSLVFVDCVLSSAMFIDFRWFHLMSLSCTVLIELHLFCVLNRIHCSHSWSSGFIEFIDFINAHWCLPAMPYVFGDMTAAIVQHVWVCCQAQNAG